MGCYSEQHTWDHQDYQTARHNSSNNDKGVTRVTVPKDHKIKQKRMMKVVKGGSGKWSEVHGERKMEMTGSEKPKVWKKESLKKG